MVESLITTVIGTFGGPTHLPQYGQTPITDTFTELWLKEEQFKVIPDNKSEKVKQREILEMPNSKKGE